MTLPIMAKTGVRLEWGPLFDGLQDPSFVVDHRGIIGLLSRQPDLRAALGLGSLPHYTTLFYAEKRLFLSRAPEIALPVQTAQSRAA